MVDDVSKFRERLSFIADKIIQFEGMARHPRNNEYVKKIAQRDVDEFFLDYTRVIVNTVENLDRRLKVLEARNRP